MASSKDKLNKQANKVNEQLASVTEIATQVSDDIANKKPQVEPQKKVVKFTKPNSDFYKMDLIKRKVVPGDKGHDVTIEEIEKDYKAYLQSVCGKDGITKYIHGLIEKDAKKNKYEW